MKLISVVMSCYNEQKDEISKAIESILNQTYKEFELIIVLDNPKNEALKNILIKYKQEDSRVKLIFNSENKGLAASLNIAIREAKGELIARMDADDISMNNRLEKELSFFNEDSKLCLVSSNMLIMDENEKIYDKSKIKNMKMKKLKERILIQNCIVHPSVMFKKSVFDKLNGYRLFPASQDYDLWLRFVSKDLLIRIIPEPLIKYRVREKSISSSKKYIQFLCQEYIKKLYYERLVDENDTYSKDNLELYLKSNGAYDKNRTEKFLSSRKYIEQSIFYLKRLRFIKSYILYNKAKKIDNKSKEYFFNLIKVKIIDSL